MSAKVHNKPWKRRPIVCCAGTTLNYLSRLLDIGFKNKGAEEGARKGLANRDKLEAARALDHVLPIQARDGP